MELIALPIYNQAHITPKRIAELYTFVSNCNEVLIIDDGSNDGLGELIETGENLKYIYHSKPLGYGGTVMSALEYATKHDFDRICFLDLSNANFTEPIAIMREHLDNGADIVNISRKEDKRKDDDYLMFDPAEPVSQRLNSVTGLNLSDVFSPFKGLKLSAIEGMTLEEFDESILLQLWIQARHFNKVVREVFSAKVQDQEINDIAVLKKDVSHYLTFIQGEILLYPQP
ncbi:MAG: glycosyltransferase [Spirochaetes bacterium]|jgi:glycosyltransferase involved in cell wall biosynthesis|nr:glycosyltransferase [Spirochaetota bacterium]